MYGEALYKPEMKEEYHILICKMRLGKPVQANGCLSYRALGIWQEHLFLHIMPKSVILSSQHREAETVCPHEGGFLAMITYSELFQFCLLLVAVISLVIQIGHKK